MDLSLYLSVAINIHPETKPEELAYPAVCDTRMHYKLPPVLELPGKNQSEKWIHAMCAADEWKKAEYMAMSEAWEEDETNVAPSLYQWCNPIGRM